MFQQELAPLGSLTVSALVALLPLLTIFVLLGVLRWKAHWAGLAALARRDPRGRRRLSACRSVWPCCPRPRVRSSACSRSCGSCSPRSGSTRSRWSAAASRTCARAFHLISDDPRVQAIIIAFCFGGLLEALAGFGAPVAITGVMLMALGLLRRPRGGGRAAGQHRPCRVRRDRHPDHHRRQPHRHPLRGDRRLRRPPDPDPGLHRPAAAGADRRRHARRAADLAGRPVGRRHLRHRPVRRVELHVGRAHRHRRLARRPGRGGRDAASGPRAAARRPPPACTPSTRPRWRGRRPAAARAPTAAGGVQTQTAQQALTEHAAGLDPRPDAHGVLPVPAGHRRVLAGQAVPRRDDLPRRHRREDHVAGSGRERAQRRGQAGHLDGLQLPVAVLPRHAAADLRVHRGAGLPGAARAGAAASWSPPRSSCAGRSSPWPPSSPWPT